MSWLLLLGCSLGTFERSECSAPVDCRQAFGFGSTCGADGYCEDISVPARCSTTEPEGLFGRTEDFQDTLLIGSLYDHERDQAELAAVQLPFKQVNDSDGLGGLPLALVSCDYSESEDYDGLSSDQAAVDMARWLIDELGIQILLGPASSAKVEAVYVATQDQRPLIISSNATSPSLTDIDGSEKSDAAPGTVWRTAPSDTYQGRIIAFDLNFRSVQKVGVIYSDDSYGASLTEVVLASYGGASESWAFDSPTSLTESLVDALADPDIQEVVFFSSKIEDIISFLNAVAAADNFGDRRIFLADGAADLQLLEGTKPGVKPLFRVIRGTRPEVPSGVVYESFKTAYSATYEDHLVTDSIFTAYAYDAAWLGIYAAAWSMTKEDEIIGAVAGGGLRRVSAGDPLEIRPTNWDTAQDLITSGSGFDVVGASGELDFDPLTEEAASNIEVWAITPNNQDFMVCRTFCWGEDGEAVACSAPNVACDPPDN